MEKIQGQLWWKNPGEDQVYRLEMGQEGETTFRYAPFMSTAQFPMVEMVGQVLRGSFPEPGEVQGLIPGESHEVSQSQHIAAVEEAIEAIQQGKFEKVVLSRSEFWHSNRSPEELFRIKCASYPAAFVYLLSHPLAGVWLGATPELLLRQSGNSFETVALAGTRGKGERPWTRKEIHEQELVTRFIQHALHRSQASELAIAPVRDRDYGRLEHLETKIAFQSPASSDHWLQVLHPTPAVGGNPRDAALEFIAQNEKSPRGYYSGYLGLSSHARHEYYVNLRCMRCFSNGFRLYAGGGIVRGSDPMDEWKETQAKIDSIRMDLLN